MSLKKSITCTPPIKCTSRKELSLAETQSLQEAAEMLALGVINEENNSNMSNSGGKMLGASTFTIPDNIDKSEALDNFTHQLTSQVHENHNGEVIVCEEMTDSCLNSGNEDADVSKDSECADKFVNSRHLKVELVKLNLESDTMNKSKSDMHECIGSTETENSIEFSNKNQAISPISVNVNLNHPNLKSTIVANLSTDTPKRRPGRPRKQNIEPVNSPIQVKTIESDDESVDAQFSKRSSRRIKKPKKFADYELNMSKLKYDKVKGDVGMMFTPEIDEFEKSDITISNTYEKKVLHVKPTVINNTSHSNVSKEFSKSSEVNTDDREVETLSAIMAEIQKIAPEATNSYKSNPPVEEMESEKEQIELHENTIEEETVIQALPVVEDVKEAENTITEPGLFVLEPFEKGNNSELIVSPKLSDTKTHSGRKGKRKRKEDSESSSVDLPIEDVSMYIISRDRPDEDSESKQVVDKTRSKKKEQKVRRLASYLEDKGIVHDGMVECKICGKLLKICSFKQHLRTHEGVKPFECGICGSCFTRKGDAERHIRVVHKQENLYSCCKCGRNFQDKKNLRWHILNHDKRMVYECEYCGFKFGKKEYYDNHVKFIHVIGILEQGLTVPEEEEEGDGPKNKKIRKKIDSKVLQLESESLVDSWGHDQMETLGSDIIQVKDNNMTSFRVISPNQDIDKGDKAKIEDGKTVLSPNIVFSGQTIQIAGLGSDNIDAAALVQELESVMNQDPGSVIVVDSSVEGAELSKVLSLDQINKLYKAKSVGSQDITDKDKTNEENKKVIKCINDEGQNIVLSGVNWEVKGDDMKTSSSIISSLVLDDSQSDTKVKGINSSEGFTLDSATQNILTVGQAKNSSFNIIKNDNGTQFIAEVASSGLHSSLSGQQVTEMEQDNTVTSDPSLLLHTDDGVEFEQLVMTKEGQTMLLTTDGRAIRVENIMPGDGETLQVVMETNEDGQPQILQVAELNECCGSDSTPSGDLVINPRE